MEKSLFRFQEFQVLLLLKEAVRINPFKEKDGFRVLYESAKHLFPEKLTTRTFRERLKLEMERFVKKRRQTISRY